MIDRMPIERPEPDNAFLKLVDDTVEVAKKDGGVYAKLYAEHAARLARMVRNRDTTLETLDGALRGIAEDARKSLGKINSGR